MPARFSRAAEHDTIPPAVAEFHVLAGHPGPADGCQDCHATQQRQRQAAASLRTHQLKARQQAEEILRKAAGS